MATVNPFDLLGDDDNDDPSHLIAAHQQKLAAKKPASPAATASSAKLPTKPIPPAQAVREAKEARNIAAVGRGGSGRGGPVRGRGGGMNQNREFGTESADGFSRGYGGGEDSSAKERTQRQPFSGGRRGGYEGRGGYGTEESGGDSDRSQRRLYERRSGTGRGYEMKRRGGGRGNWGSVADETIAQEKDTAGNPIDKTVTEKQQEQEKVPFLEEVENNQEGATNEAEEKEDKEMTLEEYEKIKEEKRKALLAAKAEERKVEIDKDLLSMQQLSTKKDNDPVFVKLGSGKDLGKKKENADRCDERSKKSPNINEFFNPAEGGRYYGSGGRGRGRGRGDRGAPQNPYGIGSSNFATPAPSIEDPGQFPTLGGK